MYGRWVLDLLLTQRLVGWLGVSLVLLLSFHQISRVFSTSTKKTYCTAVAVRLICSQQVSQEELLTSATFPCLAANTRMAVHIVPCVVIIRPLRLARVPRILLESGVGVGVPQMHSRGSYGGIGVCSIEAVGESVVGVAIEIAPIARLEPDHISIIGYQIEVVERPVLPDVCLICTTVATGSLPDM